MKFEVSKEITLAVAQGYYDEAQEHYCKPQEDLVPFKVCRSAYKAVGNYLAAFLVEKGLAVHDEMSLRTLLENCQQLSNAFHTLDLDPLFYGNKHLEEVVIADDNSIHIYLKTATKTRELILEILEV